MPQASVNVHESIFPVSRQNWTPIEIGPVGKFLASRWGREGTLTRASKVATRVRHASNPIAKYIAVVDTLDKVLSLTALGLWIATASTVLGEGIGQDTRRTLGA